MKHLALACALALSACAARSEPESRSAATPAPASSVANTNTSASASSAAPTPHSPSKGDADTVVATALELVGRVRELPAKQRVHGVRMGRSEIRAEVERLLVEETPKEALAGNAELLFAFDAVPSDFDLEKTLGLLYSAELAGFYDPKSDRMVLATDLGRDAEKMTLYHELVHALQDQYFDLGKGLTWQPEQSDLQGALHALAEGDATAAMVEIFAAARGIAASEIPAAALRLDALMLQAAPDLARVPGIIARSLIAPYADGLEFVRYLRAHRGGFAGVNQAFLKAPISTEQILHPEKYVSAEPVVALPAPVAPPGFSEPPFRDVMGEQGLRLLFEDWAPASDAAAAASDWGGDRLALFAQGNQRVVLWHLVFDNEAAARRALVLFARGALRPELTADTKDARVRPFTGRREAESAARTGRLCRPRAERGAFAIVRHGRHLGVTAGPYRRDVTSVRTSDTCPQALGWASLVADQR